MKEGWEVKKLGDIALIKGGKRVPKGFKLEKNNTGFPYIRVSDFNDKGTIDTSDIQYVNKNVYEQIKNYTINCDNLYISIAGTIGKCGIIPKELNGANLTENACKLVFNKDIYNKYILYVTQSDDFQRQAGINTRTVAMPKLALTRLSSITIPIPPLFEQQRIVEILDDAFAKIDTVKQNAERNRDNAKELFQSVLDFEMQPQKDWINCKMKEIYDVRDGTHDSPKYHEEGYPLITSKNLKEGEIVFNKIQYISLFDYKKINERSKVDIGDILFAMIGTIGNPVVVKEEPNFAIKNVALFKISQNQNSSFLKYYLDKSSVVKKMQTEAKGTTQKFVGLGYLRDFRVFLPETVEEQQQIVSKLDAFSEKCKELENNYQQTINNCDELKKAILAKAFNGEL